MLTDLIGLIIQAQPDIQIISHGYGYAIPVGRAVVRIGGMSCGAVSGAYPRPGAGGG
jgi:hypothetical protein